MAATILECMNIKKSYFRRNEKQDVLCGIDLSINRGQSIAIYGRSGTGKTTLMNLLGALDKSSSGSISLNGKSYADMSDAELSSIHRGPVGIIFQCHNLIDSWTVYENIEGALIASSTSYDDLSATVNYWLEEVGLPDKRQFFPWELSEGQQQRIAVARALVCNPVLILADEPIGDVDQETGYQILKLLNKHVKQKSAALILATHGSVPVELMDCSYILEKGKLSTSTTRV